MRQQMKPEKKCPKCDGPLSWKIVRNKWGAPTVNGLCSKCNIILRGREAPEITKGLKLEKSGVLKGVHCMDKHITSLPCDVQIGVLRQRMHPKGNEVYSPYCKKCEGVQMQYEQKNGWKCSVCNSINKFYKKQAG